MFKRSRHTLRAGRNSHRSTLKQQRGGAGLTYQGLCKWRDTGKSDDALSKAALEKWKPILENTDFKFLLEREPTNIEYITIVKRQDELFMLAMDAIYAELGANKEDESDILAKYTEFNNSTLINYIKDITYLVGLSDINTTSAKFAEILNTQKEPLLHLLLNPLRVQNHFIYNLASFIKHLNENKITDFDETKAGLMAIRYDSLAKANTLNLTSADLRDGPVLTMSTSNVTSMLGTNKGDIKDLFWYKFLMFCHLRKMNFTDTESNDEDYKKYIKTFRFDDDFKINNKRDDYAKYPLLAAYVYLIYNPVKGEMQKQITSINFGDKDITSSNGLKFLHHLIYTIETLTPSEVQTSSQGTEESTA